MNPRAAEFIRSNRSSAEVERLETKLSELREARASDQGLLLHYEDTITELRRQLEKAQISDGSLSEVIRHHLQGRHVPRFAICLGWSDWETILRALAQPETTRAALEQAHRELDALEILEAKETIRCALTPTGGKS